MSHDLHASIEIAAPCAQVWKIITDFSSYPQWNPLITHVQGNLQMDAKIIQTVQIHAKKRVRQSQQIRLIDAPYRLCWGTKIFHPRLLAAERWQYVEAISDHRCRYTTYDDFSGLLSPIVRHLYQVSLQQGFERMALALKNYAEQTC